MRVFEHVKALFTEQSVVKAFEILFAAAISVQNW